MDPEIHEITSRFERLDSALARRIAYHRILDQLHPHEWRDVRDRINARSFQKDVLGALPLEIAVQVAQYLNLEEIHRLRRISKRWYDVLSSDPVCSLVLRQYTGRIIKFGHGDGRHKLTEYAKRRVRLQRGRPIRRLQPQLPFIMSLELSTLDYANGRFAWMADYHSRIAIHDPRSQETQLLCTENREALVKMHLSESIVAALSPRGSVISLSHATQASDPAFSILDLVLRCIRSSYLCAWDLQTSELHSVRLPNLSIYLFAACGTKFALSYVNPSSREEFIMHYDLKTRATHTIKIGPNLAVIGLHPTENYVTAVYLDTESPSVAPNPISFSHLRVAKCTLDSTGGASETQSYTVDLPIPRDIRDRITIDYDSTINMKNLGVLTAQTHHGGQKQRVIVVIQYDPFTNGICLHTLHQDDNPIEPLCMASIDRNLLYYLKNDHGKPTIWISDPYSETPHRASSNMPLELPREAANEIFTYSHGFSLRGDSEFVLMSDDNGQKAWCFDELGG